MSLSHAILAALLDVSRTGYDLSKRFDRSIGYFWHATHQQIYRELARMEAEGWVSVEVSQQDVALPRKVYTITAQGHAQLAQWIAEPSVPSPVRDELMVKIASGKLVKRDLITAELQRHRQAHLDKLLVYRSIAEREFPNVNRLTEEAKYQYLPLSAGMRYEEHWVEWCDEALRLLNSK